MSTPIYWIGCFKCNDLTAIAICRDCLTRLHKEGEQGNKNNDSLLCDTCFESSKYALCEDCLEEIPEEIILDVESSNHLKKDCYGDYTKLRLGYTGIKHFGKESYKFFKENDVEELKIFLYNTGLIIGFNLVGFNGLDYKILENDGIKLELLMSKTYDIMSLLIRTFGSYNYMDLNNVAFHTLGVKKKKHKKSIYKMIQAGNYNKVEENVKNELTIIESIFRVIREGGIIKFKTPAGLIDEHEMLESDGFFPEYDEEQIAPYDFPLAGMRLPIKNRYDFIEKCKNCNKLWRIRSISYYGDTMQVKVFCPKCNGFLTKTNSNALGRDIIIEEKTK
jgi:hypothetical protein